MVLPVNMDLVGEWWIQKNLAELQNIVVIGQDI